MRTLNTLNPQKFSSEKEQLIASKLSRPSRKLSSLFGRAVHRGEASLCTGENKAITVPASTRVVHPLTQAIQIYRGQAQMDAEQDSVRAAELTLGPTVSGPVHNEDLKTTTQILNWKPDTQAEAVDAFAQTWSDSRYYANPPWSLIGRCIQQIKPQQSW